MNSPVNIQDALTGRRKRPIRCRKPRPVDAASRAVGAIGGSCRAAERRGRCRPDAIIEISGETVGEYPARYSKTRPPPPTDSCQHARLSRWQWLSSWAAVPGGSGDHQRSGAGSGADGIAGARVAPGASAFSRATGAPAISWRRRPTIRGAGSRLCGDGDPGDRRDRAADRVPGAVAY